jgi:ethanolamine permease
MPIIALVLNIVFLITTIYSNISTISWVIGAFILAFVYYLVYTKFTAGNSEKEIQEEAV